MKKYALLALFAFGLTASVPAAPTAGFEAGYLIDNKDAYWAGRVGWEFKAGSSLSHQVELEFGYTEHADGGLIFGPPIKVKEKLAPITINYRAETTPADKLGWYFGAGLGQTHVSLALRDIFVSRPSDSGNAFTLQAFVGMNYKVTSHATLHAGVKYIWIDDLTLFGAAKAKVGDDLAFTAGASVRF